VIEALLADDDATARRYAAANPAIPPARLIELLAAADPPLATGAAPANRTLPVEAEMIGMTRPWEKAR